MRERLIKLVGVLAVLAAIAVGAAAIAGGSANKPKAEPRAEVTRLDAGAKARAVAKAKAARAARATPARTRASGTLAQQPGENENGVETESESGIESEQGQPGEPAVGHEDPPGQDVNHECTSDCVE